jgi:PEP-CTERM motif
MNRSTSMQILLLIGVAIHALADCTLAASDVGHETVLSGVLYTITAVPPPFSGVSMTPEALNDLGQAVGQTFGSGGYGTFFFNGTTTTAGPSGSVNAVGINDSSTICGYMTNKGAPYIYTQNGNTVTTIGSNTSAGTYPYAINNAGQIAGYGNDPATGNDTAILYTSGTFQTLGTIAPQTSSNGFALNSTGDVVGIAAGVGAGEPFIYSSGAMHEIDSVGGRSLGINDSRQVVGEIAGGNNEGFYYDYTSNTFTTVVPPTGYSGCYLDGINNAGVAVGGFSNSSANFAGVYLPGQPMVDLNQLIAPSSGWILQSAVAINNEGQILGDGTLNHAGTVFILTPISVPEPASLSLLGLGIGLLARGGRQRRIAA